MLKTIWEIEPLRIIAGLVLGFLLASTESFIGGLLALLCGVVVAFTVLCLIRDYERGFLTIVAAVLAVVLVISSVNVINVADGGEPLVGGALSFTGSSRKCLASKCNQGECTACRGTGWYALGGHRCYVCHGDGECDACNGTGYVR